LADSYESNTDGLLNMYVKLIRIQTSINPDVACLEALQTRPTRLIK